MPVRAGVAKPKTELYPYSFGEVLVLRRAKIMALITMESIRQLLDQALHSYERKDYGKAEKAVDALLAADQNFHRGWFLKAVILEETGRTAEAQGCFSKAGSVYTLTARLALQLQESDPQRAKIYFDRALSMDPHSNFLWFHRGLLCEKAGDREEARASYRKLSLGKEVFSKIFIPVGFMVILLVSAIVMMRMGERVFLWFVITSALFCLFWIKRDTVMALQMIRKKRSFS
jgi:tetratricopeptide (TPR) repeat protein